MLFITALFALLFVAHGGDSQMATHGIRLRAGLAAG
jgi:hypothetical protein